MSIPTDPSRGRRPTRSGIVDVIFAGARGLDRRRRRRGRPRWRGRGGIGRCQPFTVTIAVSAPQSSSAAASPTEVSSLTTGARSSAGTEPQVLDRVDGAVVTDPTAR
jgi:hypothetical protein